MDRAVLAEMVRLKRRTQLELSSQLKVVVIAVGSNTSSSSHATTTGKLILLWSKQLSPL